jgi:hypothetical protein
MQVRDFLRENGIDRSFHGTQSLLRSRIVLGELHFGELVNVESHLPIVPLGVWQEVQKMRSVRGRRAKSERLLSRLGVLRCATCGGRMVVASQDQHGKRYYMYRCSPLGDCPRRVAISATIVEDAIVEETKHLIAGMKGTATMADGVADAELALERCEQELDAAVRAFSGLEDVVAARERLLELRDARDRARDRFDELQAAARPAVTVTASGDWDSLTLEERRALIRAVIDRVDVTPGGRGRDRITIHARGQ